MDSAADNISRPSLREIWHLSERDEENLIVAELLEPWKASVAVIVVARSVFIGLRVLDRNATHLVGYS